MPNKHGIERGCGAEALGLLKIGPDTTRRYDRTALRRCRSVRSLRLYARFVFAFFTETSRASIGS
jgi:uncharacterized protein (UPF0128 family)